MDESSRLGALTGVAGAALYVASAIVPGSAPKPDAPTAQVVAHYVDKRGPLLVATVLATIAIASMLWFLGYVKETLEQAGPLGSRLATVTVAAWLAALVIASVGAILSIAVIWRGASSFDPKVVQLAYDVENLTLYPLSAGAVLLSVLAPSVVIWRTRVLPRWLVGLGAIEIAINLVELGGLGSRHGANAAGYGAGLGPLVWVAWVAALSTTIYRHPPERSERRGD